ncbi:MAG: hypothetical protein IPN83_00100 [Holophagales bacterium]|nr:hypothetical protein [Holophagales bacterium]
MPSSPEYRQFVPLTAEVMAAAQAAHATYSLTTTTDGTEDTEVLALVNAMKASHIDVWSVLLNAATVPGPYFRSLI